MNEFDAAYRLGMGYPVTQSAYEKARNNGLLGGKPDPEYERESRMDDLDSLSFSSTGYESLVAQEQVDEAQERLLRLLAELQKKEEERIPITAEDIGRSDLQIAEFVVGIRDEYIEELRANDPKFVENAWEWISAEATASLDGKDGNSTETDILVAKIDAAEKMVAQLHEEVNEGDPALREDPKLLAITLSIRDELVAELTAEELARYYALAA